MMGNSFLFRGRTSARTRFGMGPCGGIKIVTGLIPFLLSLGGLKVSSPVTPMRTLVGAAAIILSLGGVIGYFVVYPYYLHKTETNGKD